ncbi:DUF3159 domain-containing protein [Plantactinospora sp. KBS50]|uniref:DUF3159 domain-containing protein n=1 Tax=Plantactinospora sp. KBS50 TaxID=2024580 RepID=UPI000BAAAE54|nr:DUF3159 domain-containing protein [Plantactinospora sp. KBS50]ASW54181.1 hypothetical protein CIK06_08190 [Plantactinospora sp. KBS50]
MSTGRPPIARSDAGATAEEPAAALAGGPAEAPLPSFAEQVADQLGGWRGMVESSVPVLVFVVANVLGPLRPAVIAAVAVAVAIAVVRLVQRRPIRHAVNGLLGVAVGAAIALRTGNARDFYLPGILYGLGVGAALLISAAVRQPVVGWIWSVIAAKGRSDWRDDPRLIRVFVRLTALWGIVWVLKVGAQAALYMADMDTALGVARIVLGYPPYALLLVITVWTVRRVTRAAAPASVEA